jgi:hypothetical protein
MNVREYLGFCAIALLLPTGALGQELPSPGERVRVWGPSTAMNLMVSENRKCELFAVRGDTLVFEMSEGGERMAVARSRIRRLDARRPRTPGEGTRLGAIVGLGMGAAAGLLLAGIASVDCSGCYLTGLALLGGIGAGVGALVGHAYPGERWEEVELGREKPQALPGRVEVAIRVQH